MRTPVRFAATILAAGSLSLAACGDNAPEAPVSGDASVAGPLEYVVTPNTVSWVSTPGAPAPTDAQTVLISGLIAAGGYPTFGAPQYTGGATGWFEMSTTPDFSRSPLGWRFTFRLRQSVRNLEAGVYQAQIPVNVPAARNNPQMITVRLNLARNIPVSGTLQAGVSIPLTLSGSSARFGGGVDPSETPGGGSKYAVAYHLTLQPGQSTWIRHTASYDSYLYVWREPASTATFVTSVDDICGLNSSVFVQNTTSSAQTYLVYASHFSSFRTGSGNIFLSDSACGGVLPGVQMEEDPTLAAAMQAEYNAKYGITQ